jgi:hypothetical protein
MGSDRAAGRAGEGFRWGVGRCAARGIQGPFGRQVSETKIIAESPRPSDHSTGVKGDFRWCVNCCESTVCDSRPREVSGAFVGPVSGDVRWGGIRPFLRRREGTCG